MNQLTLEIESKNRVISTKDQTFLNKDEEPQIRECMKRIETVVSKNRVISTKDQTFLNKDEEPRIRPQIRECMKRIETVVRKRAINLPDGMLFRVVS